MARQQDSSRITKGLSLSVAIKSGRLQEFIAQEEAAGVGPADDAEVSEALGRVIKAPRSKGRTSRSRDDGGSTS